jgi:gentisate 1,2-dioxygenase
MTQPQAMTSTASDALRAAHLVPLWEVVGNLVQAEPRPACAPCHWDYADSVRPALMAAAETLLAEEAERRVLLLANPSLPRPITTTTLAAGFQMIQEGEVAESHRHVQSALRVVVEGKGAYTAVNGERLQMERGDLILTPSWTWHDHEQPSDGPMIWLDGLDVPLMQQLSVSFYEEFGGEQVPQSRPNGFSELSYGRGLKPLMPGLEPQTDPKLAAPGLRFPYDQARAVLDMMVKSGQPSESDGYRLQYSNTVTGGHILPTIGAFLQLLPAGFASRKRRQTDAEIFLVLEGSGSTNINGEVFHWRENDVFVVPNWTWRAHETYGGAVLFSFSDRALQENLGIWREQSEEP